MHGKNGEDILITVPLGTMIYKKEADREKVFLTDLMEDGQQVKIAKGGRGGFGNVHFATSSNQQPRIAQRGEKGEEVSLILDLKLIADVGIIGHPNVGKSTLITSASAARPKIADYPFTTQEPVLGVVEVGSRSFVLAEIPGLIVGAHRGLGLGHDFLRHAERTKILVHLLDGTSESPVDDMKNVNEELSLFSPELQHKVQIVAVNKIDLPDVASSIPALKGALEPFALPVHFLSAATRKGVPELMAKAADLIDRIETERRKEEAPPTVFRPQPRGEKISVSRQEDIFIVSAPKAERLVARMDLENPEARAYVRTQLTRMGVSTALRRAGAKVGDKIRLGEIELEWG
jgi:GTP-binding protein